MKYIRDEGNLTRIFDTLSRYDPVIREHFLANLRPRVTAYSDPRQRVRTLFLIANADRQGANRENLKEATEAYWQLGWPEYEVVRNMPPAEGHKRFLEFLCTSVPHMEQKTANLFIKYVWMFNDALGLEMPQVVSWGPYLHVPLDRWVLRLLGKRMLQICSESYEIDFWRSRVNKKTGKLQEDYEVPVFGQDKYQLLQEELRQVATLAGKPAITLDGLWYVGSKYCAYMPLMCEVCCLREFCGMGKERVPWGYGDVETKVGRRERKKSEEAVIKALVEAMYCTYRRDNPDASKGDFSAFAVTEQGSEWQRWWYTKHQSSFLKDANQWLAGHPEAEAKDFLAFLRTADGKAWLEQWCSMLG